jgi:hypothetical protein
MSRGARLALLAGLAAALLPSRALACAGCRNPSLAVARGSEGPLGEGALRLALSLTGTATHVVHEAGCADPAACDEVPNQPLHLHDQRLYPLELRLGAEYGLTEILAVEAQLPFRLVVTTVEYTTPDGAPYEPVDAGVHHRNETIAGLGDPWLLLRAGGTVEGFWLAARPGVSIPLGHTEENPFALGDQGLVHQHIQLGSGTFDPVLLLEAARALGRAELELFAQGLFPIYENGHGYRAPLRVYGGFALGTKLLASLRGFLGLELFHEGAEEWDGEVRQDGNLGRTELLVAGRLAQTLGTTELSLSARVPVYRHIVEGDEPPGTLSSPLVLSLAVTHVLGGHRAEPARSAVFRTGAARNPRSGP